jgi:hypothetical protein
MRLKKKNFALKMNVIINIHRTNVSFQYSLFQMNTTKVSSILSYKNDFFYKMMKELNR